MRWGDSVKVAEIVTICNYHPYRFSIGFRRHVKGLTFAGFQNLSHYPVVVSGPWGARKFTLPPGKLVALPISSWSYAGTVFCFNRSCRLKLYAGYIVRKGEKPIWTDYRILTLDRRLQVEKPSVQPTLDMSLPKSVEPGKPVEVIAHEGIVYHGGKPIPWNRYVYFAVQNLSSESVYVNGHKLGYGDVVTARSPTHQPGWDHNFEMMFPRTGKYEVLFLASCENGVWGDAMTWYLNVVEKPTQPTQPSKPSKPSQPTSNTALYAGVAALAVLAGVGYLLSRRRR